MKNLLKLCFVVALMATQFTAFAQQKKPKAKTVDTVGMFLDKDNQTVLMYKSPKGENSLLWGDDGFDYYDITGKRIMVSTHSHVKWLKYDNIVRLALPKKKNADKKYPMLILAFNDKYILAKDERKVSNANGDGTTSYDQFYIYDYDGNLIEGPINPSKGYFMGGTKAHKKALDAISLYFGNCTTLISAMQANFDGQKELFDGFDNVYFGPGAPTIPNLLDKWKSITL